ncbi:MAG: hypothetical protein IID44_23555 [Planctomycetes bacterium]|nr:hypothetical protein [Planctomycetota bacterium]
MSNEFTVALSVLLSGGLTSILVFVARTWIGAQLKGSIEHEYAQKLESFKASLKSEHDVAIERLRTDAAQQNAVQSLARSAFHEGHRASQQRRLEAIERLWAATMQIRREAPLIVIQQDLLAPNEYDQILTNKMFLPLLTELSNESLTKAFADQAKIECERPFVGEHLWWLYFAYRAITGRIGYLIREGMDSARITHWSDDKWYRQLAEQVATEEELGKIYVPEPGGLSKIQGLMEKKILIAMNGIISGEAASETGLKQAAKIADAAEKLRPDMLSTPPVTQIVGRP